MATKKKAPASKAAKKPRAARTADKKASGATSGGATKKAAENKKTAAKKGTAKKRPVKKTAAKKAAPEVSDDYPFTQDFLDVQREALLAERGRYTQHAEFLQAEADQLAREREPGDVQFDEESGEGDSIAVERDRDLQLSAQARAAVEEIDAALARLDAGTYGICVVSGLPIPQERLEAIPHADMRVEFKSRGTAWR
jgi:RNA polymerase-binding transcription factor DksA